MLPGVDGHFIETEGLLITSGCGRSDSVIAGEILVCSVTDSPPVAPVMGPQRGSAIRHSIKVKSHNNKLITVY